MDPAVVKKIRTELGEGRVSDFSRSFPVPRKAGELSASELPAAEDLASFNRTAFRMGGMEWGPQTPPVVAVGCSMVPFHEIQGIDKYGQLFQVSTRGGRLSEANAASVNYAIHIGATFVEAVVHACAARHFICRSDAFEKMESWSQAAPTDLDDIRRNLNIDVREFAQNIVNVPEADRMHARSRTINLLKGSPEIAQHVASGQLLLGEAYYDNETHKVHWLGMCSSSNTADKLPAELLNKLLDGSLPRDARLVDIHPGLHTLNALVIGNNRFVEEQLLAVPTEVVVFACADSRLSSLMFRTPFRLVEWIRNAGNVVDAQTLQSLRVAVEGSAINLEHDFRRNGSKFGDPEDTMRPATLLVLSHSTCGAVTATLKHMTDPEKKMPEVGGIEHIINPLANRMGGYLEKYPNFVNQDEHLAIAAQYNAISACLEIVTATDPNSRAIREMVKDNKLVIIPGSISIKRGVVQMYNALTASQIDRLMAASAGA